MVQSIKDENLNKNCFHYDGLLLKFKICTIWLVEKTCIFFIFVTVTVQMSMECEMQKNLGGIYKTFEFTLT